MKKWFFTTLLLCFVILSGSVEVYAASTFKYSVSESEDSDSFNLDYYFEYSGMELSSEYHFIIRVQNSADDYYSIYVEQTNAKDSGTQSYGNEVFYFDGTETVPVEYSDFEKVILTYFYITSDGSVEDYTLVGVNSTSSDADDFGASFSGEYSVEYYEAGISSVAPSGGYVYKFVTYGTIETGTLLEFNYDSYIKHYDGSSYSNLIQLIDNKEKESYFPGSCTFYNYYVSAVPLDSSESDTFLCDLYYTVDEGEEYYTRIYYKLSGDIPEPTPSPTPTNTPKPTPTNTPTPTPSPTPAPILQLDAYMDGNNAVAKYYTGGCTPVRSTIEFYEVDVATDSLSKVNSEQFLSGAGTMRNSIIPGKVYRYKLTYIYEWDGIQFEKFLWSQDLICVDKELEDYRDTGQITNFRTLVLYVWEHFMTLELSVEGFNVSFKSLFIWGMVASIIIFFIKKFID